MATPTNINKEVALKLLKISTFLSKYPIRLGVVAIIAKNKPPNNDNRFVICKIYCFVCNPGLISGTINPILLRSSVNSSAFKLIPE